MHLTRQQAGSVNPLNLILVKETVVRSRGRTYGSDSDSGGVLLFKLCTTELDASVGTCGAPVKCAELIAQHRRRIHDS
jgi:hypothetical protein